MGFFSFLKRDKTLDLTEGYRPRQKREAPKTEPTGTGVASPFGFSFFDSPNSATTTSSSSSNMSSASASDFGSDESTEERKRRLAKRIADMTEKTEDLSNQIYHMQQRLEVLERKLDVRRT